MTPSEDLRQALATAAAVGVTLYLRGDEVRLRGNLRALPPAVRDTLRAERDTLRRLLAAPAPPPAGRPDRGRHCRRPAELPPHR